MMEILGLTASKDHIQDKRPESFLHQMRQALLSRGI